MGAGAAWKVGPAFVAVVLAAGLPAPAVADVEVAMLLNAERDAANVEPLLLWDDDLAVVDANRDYAATAIPHRIFEELAPRYVAQGALSAGEVQHLAERNRGTSVAARAVGGWRTSPAHAELILDGRFTHLTVSVDCSVEHPRFDTAVTAHLIEAPGLSGWTIPTSDVRSWDDTSGFEGCDAPVGANQLALFAWWDSQQEPIIAFIAGAFIVMLLRRPRRFANV